MGSVRWCCFRSCWTVLSHVMRRQPSCLLQSARGEANRILLASALSSMHIICPNRVSRCDWIIAVSLGCFVSLRTSSFRYKLVPFCTIVYQSHASIYNSILLYYVAWALLRYVLTAVKFLWTDKPKSTSFINTQKFYSSVLLVIDNCGQLPVASDEQGVRTRRA